MIRAVAARGGAVGLDRALVFAQYFEFFFSVVRIQTLPLQLNNQRLLRRKLPLSFYYIAFDLPQLIVDRVFVHREYSAGRSLAGCVGSLKFQLG
ncbi:hypothetical protein LRP30_36850 [Bradyrhizobium sp. C-145]|uniref:hypothetical protein n=1 Tax=Bradyrhizobium sp. C-145 TaxID=574727 RepID=UPI00201B827A|nr:hypothetical protein [Bradyrhizobium sp. C-145]UQR62287.1 hypothetical protein LRP30_36850 [Bradyrhizobium sp. C-145]